MLKIIPKKRSSVKSLISVTPKLPIRLAHTITSQKVNTPEECVKDIKSGDRLYLHSIAANPSTLMKALKNRANEFRNVEVYHIHLEGDVYHAHPDVKDSFWPNVGFIDKNTRKAVAEGRATYTPCFLSEIPDLFRKNYIPIDWTFLNVSPPDEHGNIGATRAAFESSKHIIAQINPNMPRSLGNSFIHLSKIEKYVEVDSKIPEFHPPKTTEITKQIAANIASIVEDGATLQMGIGTLPDAVLANLTNHKDLGIHTELFAEGVIDLVAKGVINNSKKKFMPGRILATFVMGTQRMYQFIHNNPLIHMDDCAITNDPRIISKNPKVTAINGALEIDITGQACADSLGMKMYSGVGGQNDFIRGASLSERGKPIIALPSVTNKGKSRIVIGLSNGAGVVTSRNHIHYVATEYGIVNLHGKSLIQRAQLLISIAHPAHREELAKQASARFNYHFKV
ncbi:acetyl-coa hydrolase-related [Anaeramoeba ignava]|uniref:Acetyl-coa hydrolase-related n=1 Tax=Anaeramoeba ignava TaxID=1746090 RepID=A0A9Q0RB23_ANAIG|nr:acetyl-coa hydrolase-related [Anaeramoeba ignava]